jgi:hypothetical protein
MPLSLLLADGVYIFDFVARNGMILVIPDEGIRRDAWAVRNPTVVQQYVAQCSFEAVAFGLSKISENFLDGLSSCAFVGVVSLDCTPLARCSWYVLVDTDISG